MISCSGMVVVPRPQVPHDLSLTNPTYHSKGMIISSEFFTVYKNLGVWEVVGQRWGWFWFSSSHDHYFTFIRSLFVSFPWSVSIRQSICSPLQSDFIFITLNNLIYF